MPLAVPFPQLNVLAKTQLVKHCWDAIQKASGKSVEVIIEAQEFKKACGAQKSRKGKSLGFHDFPEEPRTG